MENSIGIILTQWKRNHLENQLNCISKQNIEIDYIIVFQNENHVDITNILKKFNNIIHVKSDYNTKYFGRFSYFFNIPVDICIVMDDDIMPGPHCIRNYVNQCLEKNAIIGGNGRIGYANTNNLKKVNDVGIRRGLLMDFVGHLWCFKKDWLYYMFSTKPYTYDTGEDMHLCYSCKLFGNINSYVAQHNTIEECSDTTMNKLAADQFSSCNYHKNKHIPELRKNVEKSWINKGLKLIEKN